MKPTIINDSGMEIAEDKLLKWVRAITAELSKKKVLSNDKKDKELGLVFLNENDAKKLNWNYRCKDYPTDILTFDSEDPSSLGELVLCPQVIHRQAKDHGLSPQDEIGYIVLHGVLHLLGYDHEKNKEQEQIMMSLQDEVFEKVLNPKAKEKGTKDKKQKLVVAAKAKPKKVVKAVSDKILKAKKTSPSKSKSKSAKKSK